VRKLEAFFAVLIAIMALSFAWMFGEAKPDGVDVLVGKEFISLIWISDMCKFVFIVSKFSWYAYASYLIHAFIFSL
jgi:hypothetical protein